MNRKTFESLPQDLQNVMREAAKVGGIALGDGCEAQRGSHPVYGQAGHKVTRPLETFEDRIEVVYKRFSAQVGQDLINEVLRLRSSRFILRGIKKRSVEEGMRTIRFFFVDLVEFVLVSIMVALCVDIFIVYIPGI